jgi:uncharacterized membrane protein YGL010W
MPGLLTLAALALALASLLYYFTLSAPFAIGMLLMSGSMLAVLSITPPALIVPASVAIFVIAWIGQFIGHRIEGKKPSFFDDLRFLLIGPLFVLGFLYRRLGIAYRASPAPCPFSFSAPSPTMHAPTPSVTAPIANKVLNECVATYKVAIA